MPTLTAANRIRARALGLTRGDGTLAPLSIDGAGPPAEVSARVLGVPDLSWSIDQVTELRFTLDDPGLRLARRGVVRRGAIVRYGGLRLRVGARTIGPGPSGQGAIEVQARSAVVGWLRRKQEPIALDETGPDRLIFLMAVKAGAELRVQHTPWRLRSYVKKREHWWKAITRWATELGYIAFEAADEITFAQPTWLVDHAPRIELGWALPGGRGYQRPPLLDRPATRVPPSNLARLDDDEALAYGQAAWLEVSSDADRERLLVDWWRRRIAANDGRLQGQPAQVAYAWYTSERDHHGRLPADPGAGPADAFVHASQHPTALLEMPTFRESEDGGAALTVDLRVHPDVGPRIRPGMALLLPDNNLWRRPRRRYLVTSVQGPVSGTGAWTVGAAVPIDPEPQPADDIFSLSKADVKKLFAFLQALQLSQLTFGQGGLGAGPPSAGGWVRPMAGPIVSHFGDCRDGCSRSHAGVDIGGPTGTPIYATKSGVVTTAGGGHGGYGNAIYMDHGGGWASRYGHLSGFAVGVGAHVNAGQLIAYCGATGNATGPHLHFEIWAGGAPVDPLRYIAA